MGARGGVELFAEIQLAGWRRVFNYRRFRQVGVGLDGAGDIGGQKDDDEYHRDKGEYGADDGAGVGVLGHGRHFITLHRRRRSLVSAFAGCSGRVAAGENCRAAPLQWSRR